MARSRWLGTTFTIRIAEFYLCRDASDNYQSIWLDDRQLNQDRSSSQSIRLDSLIHFSFLSPEV